MTKKRKMSKKRLVQFKKIFVGEKPKILSNLTATSNLDIDGDDVDKVQGTIIESMSDRLSQRDKHRLNNIDAAISRLNEGSFGECEECSEQIGLARLTARPESTTCIECAEELEKVFKDFAP